MTTTSRASFTATLPPIERTDRADLLGQVVPTMIRRPPRGAKIPNPFRLTAVGLLTAGIVPAAWLVQRVERLISQQSQQMELVVQLIRSSGRTPDTDTLDQAAGNVTPSRPLLKLAHVVLWVAIAGAIAHFIFHGVSTASLRQLWFHTPRLADVWSMTFLMGMSLCPLLVMGALNRHIVSLQQFADAFNTTIGSETADHSLLSPALVWGLRPMYLMLGLVMIALGVFWGLPMMLGWAAFRAAAYDTTQRFRVELADRLQAISGVEPATRITNDHCSDPQCRAALPFEARYCRRCGKAVAE